MEIKVAVSKRHVHLCRNDLATLFGKDYELTKRNDLSQIGQFACNETVSLKTNKNIIENVRVVGPIREYTQVEIDKEDSEFLGLTPPVRDSGDLKKSESITIIGPKGSKFIQNCCIIANNHIHSNNDELKEFSNNDIVSVKTSDGQIIKDVHIKKDDSFVLEMHIDTYNSKIYNLVTNDVVTIEKE